MYKSKLTEHSLRVLKPALKFAKGTIKSEIKKGVSHLYVTNQGNLYVVIRPEGLELVIVAVAGSDLLGSQQEIVQFAKTSGFKSIRFHSRHPQHLKRGLWGLPYEIIEIRRSLFGDDEHVFKVGI